MLKQTLIAALFAVNVLSQNNFWNFSEEEFLKDSPDGVTPTPGAMQIFMNAFSLDQLLGDVCSFAPYYALNGKSISPELDLHLSSLDLKINNVTLTDIKFGKHKMEFVKGTDILRTTITNTDITLNVDVEATSFIPIPLKISEILLKNATMQLDLTTSTTNEVNWQLGAVVLLELEDFEVTIAEPIWQKTFNELKPELKSVINYGLKFAAGVVEGAVDAFNVMLDNQTEDMFVFDIFSLPLNLTMTRYPELNGETGEIILHVNGEFAGLKTDQYVTPDATFVDYTSMKQQREQLWLHQSTINSLLYQVKKTLAGEGFEEQFFPLVAEVFRYYGPSVTCEGILSFPAEANSQPITIDAEQGLIIGDKLAGGLRTNIDFQCGNDTTPLEHALNLELGLTMVGNITWDNFEYWAELSEVAVIDTVATPREGITLDYHNWDAELTYVVASMVDNFNIMHSTPVDLKTKIPVVAFVAGILRATLVSPFVQDEFIFAGFKMIMDH